MQEVAYESLPFANRAILHEQLALFIERSNDQMLDQVLDQLAYHYGQSQNTAKKREYLAQGPAIARNRSTPTGQRSITTSSPCHC